MYIEIVSFAVSDPLTPLYSEQDRFFKEFYVLIGESVQGYQEMSSLLLHDCGEERHGLLTELSLTVISVGKQRYPTLILINTCCLQQL